MNDITFCRLSVMEVFVVDKCPVLRPPCSIFSGRSRASIVLRFADCQMVVLIANQKIIICPAEMGTTLGQEQRFYHHSVLVSAYHRIDALCDEGSC